MQGYPLPSFVLVKRRGERLYMEKNAFSYFVEGAYGENALIGNQDSSLKKIYFIMLFYLIMYKKFLFIRIES